MRYLFQPNRSILNNYTAKCCDKRSKRLQVIAKNQLPAIEQPLKKVNRLLRSKGNTGADPSFPTCKNVPLAGDDRINETLSPAALAIIGDAVEKCSISNRLIVYSRTLSLTPKNPPLNYLAHAYLAFNEPEYWPATDRDFVKRPSKITRPRRPETALPFPGPSMHRYHDVPGRAKAVFRRFTPLCGLV